MKIKRALAMMMIRMEMKMMTMTTMMKMTIKTVKTIVTGLTVAMMTVTNQLVALEAVRAEMTIPM